jgi:serine/threonine protein kinase
MFVAEQKFGPYVLVRELGRGSFGVVWLAERRTSITTTQCALKFPIGDDLDVDAIRREASLWVKACGHPNVLPVIEAAVYAKQMVIVSEYAPEGTLTQWLRRHRGKAPSVDDAVDMCNGVLAGLEHLHSRQLLHRDLKPANILLQGASPRIADFGQARVLQSNSSTGRIAGSPAYMAPEAWDGERSVETDIWSVGVMLFEMLTGRRPFLATGVKRLAQMIRTEEPPDLPSDTPERVHQAVIRALMKAYALFADLLNRLMQELCGGTPRTRAKAAQELGRLGSEARPAVPTLCQTMRDPSALVRAAVTKSLRAIGTPEAIRFLEGLDDRKEGRAR